MVPIYQTTWHHTPEDHGLHIQFYENLRSHMIQSMWCCALCVDCSSIHFLFRTLQCWKIITGALPLDVS